MNKLTRFVVGAVIVAPLLWAGTAFASSSISNIKFDNNQTTTSCTAGQTVNVTFRVNVPSGEVAELGQVDVIGDSLAPALPTSLGGDLGLQEGANDVQMSVVCPQNTGYYTIEFRTAGIFGGQRAVNITDGVTSVGSFGGALRVVSDSSSTSTTGSSSNDIAAIVAAILAKLGITGSTTPATPVVSALCVQLANSMVGAQMNVSNSANVALQGFLLYQHQSIPALAAGASFGFWGPQTNAALLNFKAQNNCQ